MDRCGRQNDWGTDLQEPEAVHTSLTRIETTANRLTVDMSGLSQSWEG